jgi:hypothetical protein
VVGGGRRHGRIRAVAGIERLGQLRELVRRRRFRRWFFRRRRWRRLVSEQEIRRSGGFISQRKENQLLIS